MMIKVSNEFLEFDELIEVEKQIKLFEEISTTDGDFSYAFELDKTIPNTRLLGNPQPDNISKPVYQKIPADLVSLTGESLFKGFIRVEGITQRYRCSFFAGNNNWFGMLSGKMRDIDWSMFDRDMTEANLSFAIFDTSGTVFPMLDNGMLAYRGNAQLKVEDFVGAVYTKNLVERVFALQGIKIQGDLLNDADYLSSVILCNGKSEADIEARSTHAHTTSSPNPSDNAFHKMVFTNDSDYPYKDGSQNNFNLSLGRYTADVKMRVKAKITIKQNLFPTVFGFYETHFYVNGVSYVWKSYGHDPSEIQTFTAIIPLNAGDYLEVYTYSNLAFVENPITDADFEITPIFLYKAFGQAMVPDWTQGEFIAEVLKQWNVLPSYNAQNKTLTLDLFEKIKSKPAIDLSEYISETEVDYTEFISEYGKKSFLVHEQTEEEDEFKKLNVTRRPYSKGQIDVANDFLEDEVNVLESGFSAPITYINPSFDMSMEKTNLVKLEDDTKVDITSVIDSPSTPGRARFQVSEDIFALSDVVRITNSINPNYNGDYVVYTFGAGYIELQHVAFDTDSTGEITLMNFVYTDSDKVYLLHNVPLYSVIKFSGLLEFTVENTPYQTLSLGYYNIIRTNRPVDTDMPFSMAFADGDQVSFTERYFRLFSRVLNDPAKILCTVTLPYHIYNQLDFLSPVTIRTEETTNQYYLNRIRGYKGSEYPAIVELIKNLGYGRNLERRTGI